MVKISICSIISIIVVLASIIQIAHYNKCIKNNPSEEAKWSGKRIKWLVAIPLLAVIMLIAFYPELKTLVHKHSDNKAQQETTQDAGTDNTVSGNGIDTVVSGAAGATNPEESESTTEEETEQAEPELPPEQGEDVYDEEYAAQLTEWEKTADDASRLYLPIRKPSMTDEEYKGALLTWLQSEELDEAFIPKDLTEEEAIRYISEFFEDFDINAVEFDRGCMPSSTTRRQRTVREQVQAYYNDPKLEGWSDPVLSPNTFELFWEVYGTKKQHSTEWNDLVAGKTVSAETWLESYELEVEEDALDLDGFMEIAFWRPMLYQCIHNPVYADEKAQLLLLIEKEFPGWLDNAPSVKELVELYDTAMETEAGITDLLCKVELDNGQVMTCVRPEVVVKGINVYLAYRRLEIDAKNPVQAKTSTINFHLPPADGNYVRTEALKEAEDQESEPAFILSLRYKNRKQAAEAGVNVFDARDIIYIAKKPAAKVPEEPKSSPSPSPSPTPPTPTPTPPTPTPTPPGPTPPPPTPTPTPPTPTPTPSPDEPEKNPSEDVNNNTDDETTGPGDGSPGIVQPPAPPADTPTEEEKKQEEEKKEENNETPQTPENNGGANVDNGTPPDTSKEENKPQDNNNSGEGNEPPADDSYTGPPL